MGLFLALLWCASVAGWSSGLRIVGVNSRNSRKTIELTARLAIQSPPLG